MTTLFGEVQPCSWCRRGVHNMCASLVMAPHDETRDMAVECPCKMSGHDR